ncbi:MAG: YqcI/YcgG family protein [Proteobacteria bacterium]|nr:YqcI/YcgG family protein [Pseudomonadota bacterium]
MSDFSIPSSRNYEILPPRYFEPSAEGHREASTGNTATGFDQLRLGQLVSLIENPAFPCVGAKSAFGRRTYRAGLLGMMATIETTEHLYEHLKQFIKEQDSKELTPPFTTYAAIFEAPIVRSESETHEMVWKQLQMLHEVDALSHKYAPNVSSHVDDKDFAFSVCGRPFFIVGLNPFATRWSRRFAYLTLVFNAHFQFEELRKRNVFNKIQSEIRTRDVKLQGSLNPNLSDHGMASEALQYSGMELDDVRKCPFHSVI